MAIKEQVRDEEAEARGRLDDAHTRRARLERAIDELQTVKVEEAEAAKALSQAREAERARALAGLRSQRGQLLKQFVEGLRALQPINRQLFDLDEVERALCAGVSDSFGWMELVEGSSTHEARLDVYVAACRRYGYDI